MIINLKCGYSQFCVATFNGMFFTRGETANSLKYKYSRSMKNR